MTGACLAAAPALRREAALEAVLDRLDGWGWDGATCLDMLLEAADGVTGRDIRAHAVELAGGAWPRGRRRLLATLARLGGLEGAVAACAEAAGFVEIEPALACACDWGVADHAGDPLDRGRAEGVLRGDGVWIYRVPGVGMTRLDAAIAPVRRAWAVG